MTLKFNRVLEVVAVHVRAELQQAKCGGSWVIVLIGKKNKVRRKQYSPSLHRGQ